MARPIIHRPPINFGTQLNKEEIECTIKLYSHQRPTLNDVMMMLRKHGVEVEDVKGMYRTTPSDPAFYVSLSSREVVEHLRQETNLSYRDKAFDMVAMGMQVVNLRIHWLPLYFSDTIIKSVLCDYGKVIDIERTSRYGVHTGLREVRLEVDEAGRLSLPHLVKFGCGTSMLITMQGRPSLCLKCNEVGHVRKECPLNDRMYFQNRRTYAGVVSQGGQQEPPSQNQTREPVPPTLDPAEGEKGERGRTEEEAEGSGEKGAKEKTKEGETEGANEMTKKGETERKNGEKEREKEGEERGENVAINESVSEMEFSNASLKRSLRDEDESSSSETLPQRPKLVKGTRVEVENPFSPLENLLDEINNSNGI